MAGQDDREIMITVRYCSSQLIKQSFLGCWQHQESIRRVLFDPGGVWTLTSDDAGCSQCCCSQLTPNVCIEPSAWNHGSQDVGQVLQQLPLFECSNPAAELEPQQDVMTVAMHAIHGQGTGALT